MEIFIEDKLKDKVEEFFHISQDHMGNTLGIEFISIRRDEIKAVMPVDHRTVQPFGILHGGASVTLAETLASVGAYLSIEEKGKTAVGVEINANHLRPVPGGKGYLITGKAFPVHRGKKIHVWEVEITTEQGKLVCVSRCTLAIVNG